MIRSFHKRQKIKDIRYTIKDIILDYSQKSVVFVLIVFCILPGGCQPKPDASDNKFPEGIKINDLAPVYKDGSPEDNVLRAVNIALHVIEVPVENFNKMDDIRRALSISPIKFNNHLAFSENYFSAYYGKNQTLSTVYSLLEMAGAQNVSNQTIMLADGQSDNIPTQQLPNMQVVYFKNLSGKDESARIGPGFITMHIKVEKSITLEDYAEVTIFPLFTRMTTNTIREFSLLDKLQDFAFTSAAMQLNMTPGDFIFLAPERYSSDQTTLSSLFFNNPRGSIFFNPESREIPTPKPSVRVYLIKCLGMNL